MRSKEYMRSGKSVNNERVAASAVLNSFVGFHSMHMIYNAK